MDTLEETVRPHGHDKTLDRVSLGAVDGRHIDR